MKAHVKGSGGEAYPDAGGTVGGNRVVRAHQVWRDPANSALVESNHGKPYLAIPWPVAPGPVPPAPWDDPDCALREWMRDKATVRITGIPIRVGDGRWHIAYQHEDHAPTHCDIFGLRPVEKPCEHHGNRTFKCDCPKPCNSHYEKCDECGVILSDRRVTVRREGERRKVHPTLGRTRRHNQPSHTYPSYDRRSSKTRRMGNDRRKAMLQDRRQP